MSSLRSKASRGRTPAFRVPPLTSKDEDGKLYVRRADVEAEIARVAPLPKEQWVEFTTGTGPSKVSNEALVFLIRQLENRDREIFGPLMFELVRRAAAVAKNSVKGFDETTANEIMGSVEIALIDAILAETPTRQSEFLEIAFGTAVQRRTLNAVDKRKNAPLPLGATRSRVALGKLDDDEAEDERETERVPEERPGPEENAAVLEELRRRPQLLKRALVAVTDARHLEAVTLRFHGWPVTDRDPNKPILTRHFGVSARQIQNWISRALEQMRAAIGEDR